MRPFAHALPPLAALAVAIELACACGTTPGTGVEGFAATYQEGTCISCLLTACATEQAVCAVNDGCRAITDCFTASNGGTSTQFDACYANAPAGEAAYDQLQNCEDTAVCSTCATSCAPSPDDAGAAWAGDDAGPVACLVDTSQAPAQTPCERCAQQDCAAQVTDCMPGTTCAGYLVCVGSSESANLFQACEDDYVTGFQFTEHLASCVQANCLMECAQ
jgi:hypothetical protein